MLCVLACAGLWSLLAFGFNLAWEVAQVRLYTLWTSSEGTTIAWALFHCSVGDVMIAAAMYAVAGIALRRADWPASRPWMGGAIVVAGSTAFTAWSEWYNVYDAGNWAYAASMPMIFGIGLSPLVQWIVVPPVILIAYRALRPVRFGPLTSQSLVPAHDHSKGQA